MSGKDVMGFIDLFKPMDQHEFLSQYFETMPLHIIRSESEYFEKLLTIESFQKMLSLTAIPNSSIRITRDGETQRLTKTRSGYADLAEATDRFHEGWTLAFDGLQHYHSPVRYLCNSAKKTLFQRCQANVYLTPKNQQGFSSHFDTHDVFILQCQGKKKWRVYNNYKNLPTDSEHEKIDPVRLPEPIIETTLEAGDSLYIPRGWAHDANALDEHSLHITFGILSRRWEVALKVAVSEFAKRSIKNRQTISPLAFSDNQIFAKEFKVLLDEFANLVDNEEVRSVLLDDLLTKETTNEANFSDSHSSDVDSKSVIRLVNEALYVAEACDKYFTLKTSGKLARFPIYCVYTFANLIEKKEIAVSELPGLDASGQVTFARHLKKIGLVNLV